MRCSYLRAAARWLSAHVLPQGHALWLCCAFTVIKAGIQVHRSVFTAFHMKMYLEVYTLSAASIAIIHSSFAILNPANDLVGAAVSDA